MGCLGLESIVELNLLAVLYIISRLTQHCLTIFGTLSLYIACKVSGIILIITLTFIIYLIEFRNY